MKRPILETIFCCTLLASTAPAVHAGDFFVGGSVGQSTVETNVFAIDTDVDSSGDDTGYKLFGGYALGRHLTFEVALFDLGTHALPAIHLLLIENGSIYDEQIDFHGCPVA